MDSIELSKLIRLHSPKLSSKFYGCFPFDKMVYLQPGTFQIVNTIASSSSSSKWVVGHWLLVIRLPKVNRDVKNVVMFYDSFGRPLCSKYFKDINKRIVTVFGSQCSVQQYFPSNSFKQADKTTLCGLYCIFMAHVVFNTADTIGAMSILFYATEEDVVRFCNACFGQSFPRKILFIF